VKDDDDWKGESLIRGIRGSATERPFNGYNYAGSGKKALMSRAASKAAQIPKPKKREEVKP
jgi:hypothetical protein